MAALWLSLPQAPRMPARVTGLGRLVAALERGMPPLKECPTSTSAALPNGCEPAGVADDQAMYLVLPALARLTGLDPVPMLDALGGIYLVPVLALVLGLPVLLVALRRWSRHWLAGLAVLIVGASAANALPRPNEGCGDPKEIATTRTPSKRARRANASSFQNLPPSCGSSAWMSSTTRVPLLPYVPLFPRAAPPFEED